MRLIRMKEYNPEDGYEAKSHGVGRYLFRAGIAGGSPSMIYNIPDKATVVVAGKNVKLVDYLLAQKQPRRPELKMFEELPSDGSEASVGEAVQRDMEQRVAAGGPPVRAAVKDVKETSTPHAVALDDDAKGAIDESPEETPTKRRAPKRKAKAKGRRPKQS